MNNIIDLLNSLKIKPKNIELYKEALTHPSYSYQKKLNYDYQRLEFLGDSILDFIISKIIFKKYPKLSEGQMSIMRANFVKKDMLYKISDKLNLYKYAYLNIKNSNFKNNEKISSDIFESLIAAIYLDLGFKKVESFVKKNFWKSFKIPNLQNKELKNPKTILQEIIQDKSNVALKYKTKNYKQEFSSEIYHKNISLGAGVGKTKKIAEVEAAKKSILNIKNKKHKIE